MLLRILLEDEEYRPYFLCTCCMDVITKDQPGVVCWPAMMDHPKKSENGLIVHKGKCLESVKSDWESQGYRFMWAELNEELTTQLKNNTQANNPRTANAFRSSLPKSNQSPFNTSRRC